MRRGLTNLLRLLSFILLSKCVGSSLQRNSQSSKARTRRDQSKDLKKLIQELEESDYSNYGSWGNFRQRQPTPSKAGSSFFEPANSTSYFSFF